MSLCCAWFGLTFQTIGMILNIVGVATSNWLIWKVEKDDNSTNIDQGLYRVGLFRFCSDQLGECKDFPHSLDHYHDILESSQAATLVGMGLGILSVLASLWVLVLVSRDKDRKAPRVLGILLFILSPLFTAGGATIFFLKMLDAYDNWEPFDMGYSAYTCFIGAIMILLFGSITMCGTGRCKKSSDDSESSNNKEDGDTAAAAAPNPTNLDASTVPSNGQNNYAVPMSNQASNGGAVYDGRAYPMGQQQQQPMMNEATPIARTQSMNEGGMPMNYANDPRPMARTTSIQGNNPYTQMPGQYGATK